jgi:hypothetical protein
MMFRTFGRDALPKTQAAPRGSREPQINSSAARGPDPACVSCAQLGGAAVADRGVAPHVAPVTRQVITRQVITRQVITRQVVTCQVVTPSSQSQVLNRTFSRICSVLPAGAALRRPVTAIL